MNHQEFYFVEPEFVDARTLRIYGDEFKHLIQVMRKKEGDSATATDGQGNTYLFQLSKITKTYADAEIIKKRRREGEPHFRLILAQSVLKGRHLDLVIEKGTEIGVSTFIPLKSARTIVNQNEQKTTRWKRIALAAMKQSCRSILPEITPVQSFQTVLIEHSHLPVKCIAHNGNSARLASQLFSGNSVNSVSNGIANSGILVIGPEGGFTREEIELARQYKYEMLSLGQRRLRSETAGIVASTLLLEKFDEI